MSVVTTPTNYKNYAVSAFKMFYDANIKFKPKGVTKHPSFQEWMKWIDDNYPKFYEFFGKSVKIAAFSNDRLKNSMTKLANVFNGAWPDTKSLSKFISALYSEVTSVSYRTELAVSEAKEGLKDAAKIVGTAAKTYAIWRIALISAPILIAFISYLKKRQDHARAT
jgi:hypothetical protein